MPTQAKLAIDSTLLAEPAAERRRPRLTEKEKEDGRRAPRYYFQTLATATIHPVPIFGKETQECYVLTRDLSRGGISFLHPRKLVLGQRVELTFEDGRHVEGTVRWMRQKAKRCFLIGCKFTAMP
jgi:hypothetical protein